MIRNILALSSMSMFLIHADVIFEQDRSKGPHSQEFIDNAFKEYPHQTLVFKYSSRTSFFSRCIALARGDLSVLFALGGWTVKKAWSYVAVPSIVTYCCVGYCIYRVYRIIRYVDSFFPDAPVNHKKNSRDSSDDVQAEIDILLYRNIKTTNKHSEIYTKEKLHTMLQQYQHISHVLELLGIRKLFWYNADYEKKIEDLSSYLENSL